MPKQSYSTETLQAWEEYKLCRNEEYLKAKARLEKEFPPIITVRIADAVIGFMYSLFSRVFKRISRNSTPN